MALTKLPPAELERYRAVFRFFDDDGSGTVSLGELQHIMRAMGMSLGEAEMQSFFTALDEDGSEDLTFDEFIQVVIHIRELAQLSLLREDRESFLQLKLNMKLRPWAIWPDGIVRNTWDIIVLSGITLYWFVVPLDGFLGEEPEYMMQIVPLTVRIAAAFVFPADIVMRVFSAAAPTYVQPATMFTDSWKTLAYRYSRTSGFKCDLLAALPVDIICIALGAGPTDTGGSRLRCLIVGINRLLKILRVDSLFKPVGRTLVTPLHTRLHWVMLPLVKLAFQCVMVIHVFAVLWLMATPTTHATWPDCGADRGISGYLCALYFVVETLTTVGYGDFQPSTTGERMLCTMMFLCATVIGGIVVGKVLTFSQQANINSDTGRKMAETVAVLDHLDIPANFKQEILAYQSYSLQTSHRVFDATLSSLPQLIRERMELYAKIAVLRRVEKFAHFPELCLARLAQSLESLTVGPDTFILMAGEEALDMFFLLHGMCGVMRREGQWIAVVKRGGIFGTLTPGASQHSVSIKSLTYCHLFQLSLESYADVAQYFPMLEERVVEDAADDTMGPLENSVLDSQAMAMDCEQKPSRIPTEGSNHHRTSIPRLESRQIIPVSLPSMSGHPRSPLDRSPLGMSPLDLPRTDTDVRKLPSTAHLPFNASSSLVAMRRRNRSTSRKHMTGGGGASIFQPEPVSPFKRAPDPGFHAEPISPTKVRQAGSGFDNPRPTNERTTNFPLPTTATESQSVGQALCPLSTQARDAPAGGRYGGQAPQPPGPDRLPTLSGDDGGLQPQRVTDTPSDARKSAPLSSASSPADVREADLTHHLCMPMTRSELRTPAVPAAQAHTSTATFNSSQGAGTATTTTSLNMHPLQLGTRPFVPQMNRGWAKLRTSMTDSQKRGKASERDGRPGPDREKPANMSFTKSQLVSRMEAKLDELIEEQRRQRDELRRHGERQHRHEAQLSEALALLKKLAVHADERAISVPSATMPAGARPPAGVSWAQPSLFPGQPVDATVKSTSVCFLGGEALVTGSQQNIMGQRRRSSASPGSMPPVSPSNKANRFKQAIAGIMMNENTTDPQSMTKQLTSDDAGIFASAAARLASPKGSPRKQSDAGSVGPVKADGDRTSSPPARSPRTAAGKGRRSRATTAITPCTPLDGGGQFSS